jgi:hypothetical protein
LLQRGESFLREGRFLGLRKVVEEILQPRLRQRGLLELGQGQRSFESAVGTLLPLGKFNRTRRNS